MVGVWYGSELGRRLARERKREPSWTARGQNTVVSARWPPCRCVRVRVRVRVRGEGRVRHMLV